MDEVLFRSEHVQVPWISLSGLVGCDPDVLDCRGLEVMPMYILPHRLATLRKPDVWCWMTVRLGATESFGFCDRFLLRG